MNNLIKSSIKIHDGFIPYNLFEEEDKYFGVVEIKILNIEDKLIYRKPQFIKFTLDYSGSMADICHNNKSKMDYLNHTMENMLRVLVEKTEFDIIIQIDGFESKIHKVIDPIKITSENIDNIIDKIKEQKALDLTNIELALINANNVINSYKTQNNDHEITHIFMTDGAITLGEKDPIKLKELINSDYANIFIGFGKDHDSVMLHELGKSKYCSYNFIDKIENSCLVYGEIINNVLYKVLNNVKINIKNGLIYDYLTDTWNNSLRISSLSSDSKKNYHIKTNDPLNLNISIYGINNLINNSLLELITIINEPVIYINLINELFRNKILSLIFKCLNNKSDFTLKEQLNDLLNTLKKFMNENNLYDDIFYNILCGDIEIVLKTMGTKYEHMFSISRHMTQGSQGVYNVTFNEESSTQVDDYNINNQLNTTYSSQNTINLMNQFKKARIN